MRLCLFAFLFIPLGIYAAPAKEIVELQRDVASLQDQVRSLQSSQTEKFAAILTMIQQTLDESKSANKSVAVLESKINDRLERQTASVSQPVAVIGTKVDQMSGEFQGVRETLNDVGSRIGKIEQRLVDLNNVIRTIQAPPPAPGAASAAPSAGGPPMPANALYESSVRDRNAGNAALALKGFSDYVQYYGDTAQAPSAQYNIGQVHYDQGDFESAVKDFDAVVERYGSSDRTADALFMKGQSLVKMNKKTDGAKEFRAVLAQYPRSEAAPKACNQLKALALSCTVPAGAVARKKKG